MPSANNEEEDIDPEDFRDQLLPFLNPHSEVAESILNDGYCILPSILTDEEADDELDRMWSFISKIKPDIRRNSSYTWKKPLANDLKTIDPWPCAQRDVRLYLYFLFKKKYKNKKIKK